MKKLILATTALVFLSTSAFAAPASKSYPIVGQVIELSASKIVVQAANKRKWEISRDAASKVPADVKVGSIVVVQASLIAGDVVDKTPKAAAAAAAGTTTTTKTESKTETKTKQ